MTSIIITASIGAAQKMEAQLGLSLMEIIRDAGFDDLQALCGGCCSCATCHVYVEPERFDQLPPMSQDENDLLDSSDHRQQNSRLSCQVQFTESLDGLKLTIAPAD